MWLYFLILKIAALWNPKAQKLVQGQKQSLSRLQDFTSNGGKFLWLHAASVGEFEQGRPVIEKLKQLSPNIKIVVSFFSPSGYEAKKDYPLADLVIYLPFATNRNARKFISAFNGNLIAAIFVKYEYWPAYLKQLKKSAVPTFSIASIFRPYQAFFRPIIGPAYRSLLKCFTSIMVQDQQSRLLLEKYGINNSVVCGDPRFNRVLQVVTQEDNSKFSQINCLIKPKTIVAGSTWPKDEQLLARFIREHDDLQLVLVPHEINPSHLQFIFNLFEGKYILYSELNRQNAPAARVVVVDQMGLLSRLYRYGAVAYIGGGFGAGIHNTIEAAAYSMPVVFGPNNKYFREAQDLKSIGAGFEIKNYQQLEQTLCSLLADPKSMAQAAHNYVISEQNATDLIIDNFKHTIEL